MDQIKLDKGDSMRNFGNASLLLSHLIRRFWKASKDEKRCITLERVSSDGARKFTYDYEELFLNNSGLYMYLDEKGKSIISGQELTAEQCYYLINTPHYAFEKSPIPLPLCIVGDGRLECRMTVPTDNDLLQITYYHQKQERPKDKKLFLDSRIPYISMGSRVKNKPIDPQIVAASDSLPDEFVKVCSRLFE